MCGIAGAFGACTPQCLQAMAKKMAHRGPDNLSVLSLGDVHLAHARLSILDLSPHSNQPLWDIQRTACIVFNGEIYNYKALRDELVALGYTFTSEGDAEVIVNLYLHYGVACLEKLNGIFAFALWDTRSSELFLARDPLGVKPLYYSETKDGFYFSSEMKSLLVHPNIARELNHDAIFRSLVFLWSPGPETVLKNIFKLEPGTYLRIKDRNIIEKTQYAEWPHYQPEKMSVKQGIAVLDDALRTAVNEQLVSDVPVGSFLSGGLDSSLIVAMAKKTGLAELECFTIKSKGAHKNNDGFVDDLPYARTVAKHVDVHLNEVEVKPDMFKRLAWMMYHLDEPQADPAPLNVSLICEEARNKGIKVLFSGAGGDDVFTGYRRHYALKLEKYWSWLPASVRRGLQNGSKNLPKRDPKLRRLAKIFAYAGESKDTRLLSYFYWIKPEVVRDLLTDEVKNKLSDNPMAGLLNELKNRPEQNDLEKMLYLERRYFLVDHNLNYTDKMSMAHGVEVRVPLLDKRVAECASRIHTKFKQHGRHGKWILKKMAERYLPKSVIYRSKAGFGAPLRDWLKHDLIDLVDELLGEQSLSKRGIFKYESVRALIEEDRRGEKDYSYPIFALLCIELWCRIFIDGDTCYEQHAHAFENELSQEIA
ncbi:MAG: asparagine synthase (glutamine-hydrolyzing) [Legionellaceae bacterium]|nr:asparagine synthase (glutamine-hydrolyzing) [Legionellaceae bacterium]